VLGESKLEILSLTEAQAEILFERNASVLALEVEVCQGKDAIDLLQIEVESERTDMRLLEEQLEIERSSSLANSETHDTNIQLLKDEYENKMTLQKDAIDLLRIEVDESKVNIISFKGEYAILKGQNEGLLVEVCERKDAIDLLQIEVESERTDMRLLEEQLEIERSSSLANSETHDTNIQLLKDKYENKMTLQKEAINLLRIEVISGQQVYMY
jgi:FtsZ-binding cell division protein ZapB